MREGGTGSADDLFAPPPARPGAGASEAAESDTKGHRQRLKRRFETAGADSLADYEFLELVLFRSIPRRDTKPIAKSLLKRFGTFWDVITAPSAALKEVDGIGDGTVLDFRLYEAAITRAARERVMGRQVLASWDDVLAYCRVAMARETREQFRLLFLDKKNRLIGEEVQQVGTVDHTPVYPREVVKRALELSATALILVHNHPSGDPTPSRDDITMTQTLVEVAAPLGIVIHDHVIIGRDGTASLRTLGLMG